MGYLDQVPVPGQHLLVPRPVGVVAGGGQGVRESVRCPVGPVSPVRHQAVTWYNAELIVSRPSTVEGTYSEI